MIDVENFVYTQVVNAVHAYDSRIECSGDYISYPKAFPAVYLYEADNNINTGYITSDKIENYANVMYECQIFTADAPNKKERAKSIAKVIDGKMQEMGFLRTMVSKVPNITQNIYRIVIRWNGVLSDAIASGQESNHYVFKS